MRLNVNGRSWKVEDAPDTPLLWVLRDSLHLRGTKYGCGIGMCGACTVHVNGNAVRACQTPLSSCAGKKVTTIEGLSSNGTHPLQLAWQDVDVPQCGYCQAGQIMQAAALLKRSPRPSDAQIVAAMEGNLCRCGTYPAIRTAIRRAAAMTPLPMAPDKRTPKASGKNPSRANRGGEE
jgi:isoquinoline 1-oxidoreductase alpha subunit